MSIEVFISFILTVGLLGLKLAGLLDRTTKSTVELAATDEKPEKSGITLISIIASLVFILAIATLFRYWDVVSTHTDDLLYSAWLAAFMVTGMIVQAIATNYRDSKKLLPISIDQLVYPLLFSVVVFYPIWAIAASAPRNLFVFHAAFLNGYFWESIVANAKPIEPK
jgi:hypothetical protein